MLWEVDTCVGEHRNTLGAFGVVSLQHAAAGRDLVRQLRRRSSEIVLHSNPPVPIPPPEESRLPTEGSEPRGCLLAEPRRVDVRRRTI
jgi:hypothetical protein